MHCFSFDIETIPDVESGRKLFDLDGLEDEDVGTEIYNIYIDTVIFQVINILVSNNYHAVQLLFTVRLAVLL